MSINAILIILVFFAITVLFLVDLSRRTARALKKSERLFEASFNAMEQLRLEKNLKNDILAKLKKSDEGLNEGSPHEENEILVNPEPAILEEPPAEDKVRKYQADYQDMIHFPCLSADDMVTNILLPKELETEIRDFFGAPDNERLIGVDAIRNYIDENDIIVSINYPKGVMPTEGFPIFKETGGLGRRPLTLAIDQAYNLAKIIRYTDGDNGVVSRECESRELYESYLQHFGGVVYGDKIPTADQFVEWYNNAVDTFAQLNDTE